MPDLLIFEKMLKLFRAIGKREVKLLERIEHFSPISHHPDLGEVLFTHSKIVVVLRIKEIDSLMISMRPV